MIALPMRVVIVALLAIASVSSGAASCPQWLNVAGERGSQGGGFLRKTIQIGQPVTSAELLACGDATFVVVQVGGDVVAELEPYAPVFRRDVTELCAPGHLVVAMHLKASPPNTCAGFVQLDLKFADGSRQTVVSDSSWRCSGFAPAGWTETTFDDSSWQRPLLLGEVDSWLIIHPSRTTDIDVAENYDQWKQAVGATAGTDPASFQLTDGFEIELLRSAKKDEDSWVSLAVDSKGRMIIAKEKVGLLRVTLDQGGNVEQVEAINSSMQECRGLTFIDDDLYVNANDSKGLYRLPATGNDRFGDPELIYASSGGVGHGRNDLTLGPDGLLYSIQGDSVDLPTNARDFTSPFRDARRGIKTSEGHLLRIDPTTKAVEVLATGLRNPFGIAFNPRSDCFTYDADAEYDMGAPWYRPTRVSHLLLGGDYGWRGVTQQWPPYYPDHPDNAVPGLNIGKGSPTAVKFGTQSNFPSRYRDALFILDWTYGRIIAVHTIARGSSYLMTAETFLQGRPLNVTDLDFGPDGSMYLVTGGRATQSALYRIRYTGPEVPKLELTQQQEQRHRVATAMHTERRDLERRLANGVAGLTPALASDDPWLRGAARNLLERVDLDELKRIAVSESDPKVAISAMMCLARSGDVESRQKIVERLCEINWQAMSRSWRESAAYTLWLCTANAQPGDVLTAKLVAMLEGSYPERAFSVNRIVSEILVHLKSEVVVEKTLELAATSPEQSEQMHYLFALRKAQVGWTLARRQVYFQLLARANDYIGGQGMNDFLTKIRADAVESLSSSERAQLANTIEASAPNRKPHQHVTAQRPVVAQWTLEALSDAIKQRDYRGDPEHGKQMFAAASCVHCHRVSGYGRLIGPDLTNVSRRFSQRDLLTSIVEPSKVVPEKYQSMQVVTEDGRVFVGLTALGGDYRSTKLRLATNVLDPYAITEIEKSEIEEIRPSQTSWMPTGLLNTLTAEEVLDLLAYLNAGR